MPRVVRLALLAALLIVVTASAGVLAFNGDGGAGESKAGHPEEVIDRLADAGIDADPASLDALADTYGLGGAVRILAFADAAGIDPAEVAAMRDDGMGWGEIARALGEAHDGFDLKPGIGWVMGGHGQEHGQGQGNGHGWGPGGNPNKDDAEDDPSD